MVFICGVGIVSLNGNSMRLYDVMGIYPGKATKKTPKRIKVSRRSSKTTVFTPAQIRALNRSN